MISALCHPRPAEHSSTLLYPASEEPPGEGESEAALRLPKAESRRQPEIQYTRALAEINSGLDLLTHSILRILAPRYRRVNRLCLYTPANPRLEGLHPAGHDDPGNAGTICTPAVPALRS